ncbi:organic solute transporter subunit alpha-like [Argiope bruennichi]|uniref:Organic solute transporter subunit alpha like protein n=1 Tax=Argiope bruennichi TaxID=94029 RepID=A0A8T0G300_ARGBR|nr:organic solute transporter subunit alpha-like [Argiope bruennichi]XP_055948464.1 organic solute transporter subunit alpha-like [Argiope bruennichi]KAF8795633.1 Organic solute transporter subunit alpha like protein [Argiope bruennichi]
MMNCSYLLETEYIPTMEEAVTALGELSIGLVILGGIVTTGIYCIYIEELIYLYRNWPVKFFLLKLGCLSIFPLVGSCFFLNLLIPRATEYTTNTVILSLPAPLVLFFWVVIGYASKERHLLERLEDKLIPLQGPPCCWFCLCCPKLPFSKQRFKVVKACIYQFFLTPVILFIIATVCSKYGVFKELKFVPDNAAPYLVGLNFASFFIGVYGLVIFMKTTSKLLHGFHIHGKFLSLQLQFILVRFHFFTFDTLGRLGFFPCHPPVSSLMTALYIRSALLLGEGFILSVVGRFFFLHAPPPHFVSVVDTTHSINQNA